MAILKKIITLGAIGAFAAPASAQVTDIWLNTGTVGNFFVCIFAGVLLAFAFQFLLTNLSVALGISAIGDITEKSSSSSNDNNSDNNNGNLGVKVFTGLGIFMTITMSLSLFFASMIAVKLSLLPADIVGFTLGIVIWAGFILISIYLDAKLVSSMAGGLINVVKTGLGLGSSAVSGVLSQSKASQMKDIARETVSGIHDEVRKEFDLSDVEKKLDTYVEKLAPQEINFKKIKKQLADLLHEIEVKEQYTPNDPDATKKLILEISDNQPTFSEDDKKKFSSMIDEIKASAKTDGDKIDKVVAGFDKLSPGDETQGAEYREKIEAYLKDSGSEDLQPDQLKDDLNKMLDDPKAAPEVIKARLSKLDKDSLKSFISQIDGMNEEKADKYLSIAESVINTIRNKVGSSSSNQSSNSVSEAEMEKRKSNAGNAVQNWFNSMNQPELSYGQIKSDAKRIFDDPKATPQVLRNRLNRMDRESFVALLSNNPWVSERQAEKIADDLEQGKQSVIQKADQIEAEISHKVELAKEEGLKQAEAARKSAMSAAWWLFISSVASAVAAGAGGMLALNFL